MTNWESEAERSLVFLGGAGRLKRKVEKKEFQVFHSFAESERADREYYLSLSPSERLEILFELIDQYYGDEAAKGFERVYRITQLHES